MACQLVGTGNETVETAARAVSSHPVGDATEAGRRRGAVVPSPVFVAFAAAAAGGGALAWRSDFTSTAGRLGVFVMVVAGWVVSLSLHEFAHAYTAYRAGDRTAADAGYLTLNPFRYTHPVLSIVLPLLAVVQGGIGLPGGAVQLNHGRFASRAWRSAVSAAGPATNVVVAGAVLWVVRAQHHPDAHPAFWAGLAFFAFLQVSVAVLNLLPVPGLDGWSVWEPYVRADTAARAERVKPYGLLGVFMVLSWIQPVNTAFFDVVDRITTAAGVHPVVWQTGEYLFRFWQR